MNALEGFESEHGLSYLIEIDQKKFLFDTGASDLFIRNAARLEINLEEIDRIILSHGHWDHGNGLKYLKGKPLICHPSCFEKRYRKPGKEYLGLTLSREELSERFDLEIFRKPIRLSRHLWFLGEVPRRNDFEAQTTKYMLEDGTEDYIMDDSGLVAITRQGLVLISGCAHSGICNMIEHAMRVTGIFKVIAVIGGFHLRANNSVTRKTISCLEKLELDRVIPSHCTVDPALDLFRKTFGSPELRCGACLVF
jgi:7,8-dihydropterin-6-yl-methyl-4-(beta-D-ribofuranosyl)aminobenzene 5'-phosphate synthase